MSSSAPRLLLLLCALCGAQVAAVAQSTEIALARRIDNWHKAWLSARISLVGNQPDDALARQIYGTDLIARAPQVLASHRHGLRALLADAAAADDAETAAAVLELAAEGTDDDGATAARQTGLVREEAHLALGRMNSSAALDLLIRAARGAKKEVKELSPWRDTYRLAAIRALGIAGSSVVRFELARQLEDKDRDVRIAAAEALGMRASAHTLDALGDAAVREKDMVVALAILDAIHASIASDAAHLSTETARRTLSIALDCLGRFDWRCDSIVVEICGRIRSPMSIEPLIGVLERCLPRRDGDGERLRSGTLRDRAQTVLRDLTGTLCQANRPDQWRAFWNRVRDGFQMPPPRGEQGEPNRTTSGFYGIPVTGLRVLFVIDTSGSMNAPITVANQQGGTSTEDNTIKTTRLEQAKSELLRAVESLPADARFGVISFSGDVRRFGSPLWQANESARSSLRQILARLSPSGGTNLYGALSEALDIDHAIASGKEGAGIDELFVLSDGQPSAGDIVDTEAILAAVRRANHFRRVRIHTVMLGGSTDFTERLARENGGRCVAR